MQGMSERQYAAHVGLSRGAFQKAKAAERLVLYPDGSINAARRRGRTRRSRRSATRSLARHGSRPEKPPTGSGSTTGASAGHPAPCQRAGCS